MTALTYDDAAAPPAALTAYIEAERRRADVAGIAVVAFDREGIRMEGYFGYADLATGERVTSDTAFRAASISKMFTTALVLQEVSAGAIALDDPVNRHLDARTQLRRPGGQLADDVTLRHLLSHTSGLPVSWKGLEYGNVVLQHLTNGVRLPRTLDDVVAAQRTTRPPGGPIVYSNGGFSLLGYLVARLNRRPFEDLVQHRVLAPLGMRSSIFAAEPRIEHLAVPYGKALGGGAGRKAAPPVKNITGPAGALVTTARDLARFGRMVLRGGALDEQVIVPPGLLDEATRIQVRNHPELDEGWGLGLQVGELRGRRRVGHDGGLAGVSTRISVLPDDGVGVVVLTNGGDAMFVSRVSERVLETMLGLEAEPLPGAPAGVPAPRAGEWRDHTRRVVGRYRMLDITPPGPLTLLAGFLARPRISEVGDSVLAIEGTGYEAPLLYPDGPPGRYRVAHPLVNGGRAIIEERAEGVHLWASTLHLVKR